MTEEKIKQIAELAECPLETTRQIIDPDYTYWSQRGDSTREEHLAFLDGSPAEIAAWVRSVANDLRDDQETIRLQDTWATR